MGFKGDPGSQESFRGSQTVKKKNAAHISEVMNGHIRGLAE